jgi:hypothetical protein
VCVARKEEGNAFRAQHQACVREVAFPHLGI